MVLVDGVDVVDRWVFMIKGWIDMFWFVFYVLGISF